MDLQDIDEIIDLLPDEDIGPAGEMDAEEDENVIAAIMAKQAKNIARSRRLELANDFIDEERPDTDASKDRVRSPRPTNFLNETPAPFMSIRLQDSADTAPRPDKIVRDIWLRILPTLDNKSYCVLARVCRYFRQLLQATRPERMMKALNNKESDFLGVIRRDEIDLLQAMCINGKVVDLNIAIVHALHNRSIKCISYLQDMQPDISAAFTEILKLDNLDLFKIARKRGMEILDRDIGQIIEYDALNIFSYLMHLIEPRLLISVELDRTPDSMRQMMLHAAYYCSYKIIGYLRSLGVEYIPPPEVEIGRKNVSMHQYSVFGSWHPQLMKPTLDEDKLVATLKLYHQPDSNLPRLKDKYLQYIVSRTGFKTFKLLAELGYENLTDYLAPSLSDSPPINPERELYIVEVLKKPLSEQTVARCIQYPELFRRLHELGLRASDDLVGFIMRNDCSLEQLKLAHELGYNSSNTPIDGGVLLPIATVHYLLKCGYTFTDFAKLRVYKWSDLEIESHELETLYQLGFRWNERTIKEGLDKDLVNLIAASVNLEIWHPQTNVMLWVIASRAKACFEYLIHKDTLPYAAQAFKNVKQPNTLSDDFPVDWMCLAFYMPWPWLVTWIKARASPALFEKIKANAREWTRTQGLDRYIPPNWHDIRNFIAKRLVVDGRPRVTRDLLEGNETNLIMFDD